MASSLPGMAHCLGPTLLLLLLLLLLGKPGTLIPGLCPHSSGPGVWEGGRQEGDSRKGWDLGKAASNRCQ